MKRVLTFLAIMLLPLSVMAMTPVSDQTLSDVTGQAGVNINADLTMNINIGTMAWGDADGIRGFEADGLLYSPWGTMNTGGYVGVTEFNITNLRIKARETDTYNGWNSYTGLKPITIDVATAEKAGVADVTFVRFGLGSLQISMDAMSFNVALGTDPAAGLDQVMGVVSIGDMAIYINPRSYVDIYAHAGCGVNLEFNIIVDEFQLDYVSWGDTDGLTGGNPGVAGGVGYWIGATNAAGYVGLDNLRIGGPITVAHRGDRRCVRYHGCVRRRCRNSPLQEPWPHHDRSHQLPDQLQHQRDRPDRSRCETRLCFRSGQCECRHPG